MKLGVVGMLPADIRTLQSKHLKSIRALQLTAACFHVGPELLFELKAADYQKVKSLYADHGMEPIQMGIGYRECLFDPDAAVRQRVVNLIGRGLEVAREFGAQVALIRTGSLNPSGSYNPSRKNHTPEALAQLVETLRMIAAKAEAVGQTVVIETHVLTILNSPEIIVDVVKQVGSQRIQIVMDYVNHFQTLSQVYDSTARLNHIFDTMGALCPVAHCKDITLRDGLVLHIDEEVPGEGELDLATAFRRWHALDPNGYMLLEHLPNELYPLAAGNAQRIATEAGVPIA